MIELDEHTRFVLRQMQRREKDRRRLVRITVILMLDGGISIEDICYTFGIDASTIYRYAEKYRASSTIEEYLADAYTGNVGNLSPEQCRALSEELRRRLYRSSAEIATYISERFGVSYTPNGAVALVKRLGFIYKKTRQYSSKSDSEQQEAFVEEFDALVEAAEASDSI